MKLAPGKPIRPSVRKEGIRLRFVLLTALGLLLPACTCQPPLRLRIGVIDGAGCGLLPVAAREHLFDQQEMQVEIVRFPSLAHAQGDLMQKPFDLFCASLVDLLLAPQNSAYRVILIPDYSNGADVLIARKDAGSVLSDLKGARIGVPPTSMGELLLNRALIAQSLTREDFTILPEEADGLQDALQKSEIQMAVAGPPVSLEILKNPDMQVIYQSSAMPGDLISTLSASEQVLQNSPELIHKLRDVWVQALQYAERHPTEAKPGYTFVPMHEQDLYLRSDGRLPSLIDQLQGFLLQSGSLKNKQDGRHFLYVPTKK